MLNFFVFQYTSYRTLDKSTINQRMIIIKTLNEIIKKYKTSTIGQFNVQKL